MNNITNQFMNPFLPFKALAFYRQADNENEEQAPMLYVESYDIAKSGRPLNAHPLTNEEMIGLFGVLQNSVKRQNGYLQCPGLLPENLLHLHTGSNGHAVWYTPPAKKNLFFSPSLDIPCGAANVPAMVWKANKTTLWVYALKTGKKPQMETALYRAPFYNIYSNGKVCMGDVKVVFPEGTTLTEFMSLWEKYFWASYFVNLLDNSDPVKGDLTALWKSLLESGKPFPTGIMKKTIYSLSSLFV